MLLILIILAIIVIVYLILSKKHPTAETPAAPSEYTYGYAWPKPNADNLWDTLDFFTRLAEVQSSMTSYDLTTVSVVIHTEDSDSDTYKRGTFSISFFDFERAQNFFKNKIPYIGTELVSDDDIYEYKGYDPNSTILIHSPEKIYEIIKNDTPHAVLSSTNYYSGDHTLCMRFTYPARR